MNTDRNKKIEDILNSLDGINRAPVPDFFFTRVMARMERQQEGKTANRPWLLRPAFAFGISVAVLIVNAALLIQKQEKQSAPALADTEKFQSIASEYSLNDNVAYDQSPEK